MTVHVSGCTKPLTGHVRPMYKIKTMHLSDYMQAKKLSDEDVAKVIRRSRATVSRIRRKKVRLPTEDTLLKLREFSEGEITADDFVNSGAAG